LNVRNHILLRDPAQTAISTPKIASSAGSLDAIRYNVGLKRTRLPSSTRLRIDVMARRSVNRLSTVKADLEVFRPVGVCVEVIQVSPRVEMQALNGVAQRLGNHRRTCTMQGVGWDWFAEGSKE
jgi:hypothetical protein